MKKTVVVFGPEDFRYDPVARTGICPAGKSLNRRGAANVTGGHVGEHCQGAQQSIMSDEFVAAQGDIDTVGTFLASIDVKRCLERRNAAELGGAGRAVSRSGEAHRHAGWHRLH